MRLLESLGFYSGLGAVIVFMAAVALGRLARAAQPRGHGTVYPGGRATTPAPYRWAPAPAGREIRPRAAASEWR